MHFHQTEWAPAAMFCLLAMSVAACNEGADTTPGSEILAAATEGGWQNVDLLVPSGDPLKAAKDCVERRSGATGCYVFLTRDAYEAAQPKAAGNFSLTCWAARWTRNKLGTVSGGLNEFMPPGCPASSKPQTLKAADEAPPEPPRAEPFELKLTFEPEVTNSDQILLQGTTNLPDGTKLSTSVSSGAFMGQDEAIVNGGRWRSGPFGPRTGLEAGTYEASATLPYGRTQPEAIQAQLGRQLEKLTGPLMETNPELEFMGQSANVTTIVTVR